MLPKKFQFALNEVFVCRWVPIKYLNCSLLYILCKLFKCRLICLFVIQISFLHINYIEFLDLSQGVTGIVFFFNSIYIVARHVTPVYLKITVTDEQIVYRFAICPVLSAYPWQYKEQQIYINTYIKYLGDMFNVHILYIEL